MHISQRSMALVFRANENFLSVPWRHALARCSSRFGFATFTRSHPCRCKPYSCTNKIILNGGCGTNYYYRQNRHAYGANEKMRIHLHTKDKTCPVTPNTYTPSNGKWFNKLLMAAHLFGWRFSHVRRGGLECTPELPRFSLFRNFCEHFICCPF